MRRTRFRTTTAFSATALAAVAAVLTAGCAAPGNATRAQAQDFPTPALATTAATHPPATANAKSSAGATASAAAQAVADGYDATRDARADIRAALARAARDHREVLLDFGANWCPDCRSLDVLFRSARVEPVLTENYVVVSVDVGEFDHNIGLADQYVSLQTSGIPALAVLNPDGTKRTATDDGSFADARTMKADEVRAFLSRWAPAGDR